ncbi:hypothetical protein SLE2022_326410 [Rubroshorea leprosula]
MAEREDMKDNGELEMLLNQISQTRGSYLNLHHRQKFVVGSDSPSSRVSLQSPYSASSSISNGFSSSDDGSSFPTMFNEAKYEAPCHANGCGLDYKPPDSYCRKSANEKLASDYFLAKKLNGMSIRDKQRDFSTLLRGFETDQQGFAFNFGDGSTDGNVPYNVEKYGYGSYDDLNYGDDFGCEGFQSYPHRYSKSLVDDTRSIIGVVQDDLLYPYTACDQYKGLCSDDSFCYSNQRNYSLEQGMENGINWDNGGIQSENTSSTRHYLDFAQGTQHFGVNYRYSRMVEDTSSSLRLPKLASNVDKLLPIQSFLRDKTTTMPNHRVPKSVISMESAMDLETCTFEDSFIIQGKSLERSSLKEIEFPNLQGKSSKLNSCINNEGINETGQGLGRYSSMKLISGHHSLAEFQGCIYSLAKDQKGCRFLQRMFKEGITSLNLQILFNGIIDHAVEVMLDPFGNYLMQKLLEVCSEEQRMQIVVMVTKEPGQLVRISLNTYGTRVIQKLIETLKCRQEISLVKSGLKSGILDLIKDLNGIHVLQRCLQCLSKEDNEFIFDAAAKFCVDIATHRHGCCVLNRCIDYSTGQHRDKLINQILRNGLLLAQDPFGNYVVQYIMDLQISAACLNLLCQFKGHYVQFSMQKFSSHVVEKCLKILPVSRSQIITELLLVPNFEQLLQDPFANYVIQSALVVAKGTLRASLIEAIRPHTTLQTSPYAKRIFTRKVLK